VKITLDTRRLLVAIILLGLFAMAVRPVTDPDVWWHLKTGELISSTHHVPHTDPFSFTRAGQPWVNHEWLSDWLIFRIYTAVGLAGLDILFAGVLAAALFIVFLRSAGRPFLAGLFTICGAVASAPSWGVRPQMISLLLASMFLWILERTERHPRAAWWMPPIMLLWVNLHAGYVLGIALIALFALGKLCETALGSQSWQEIVGQTRTLFFAGLACLAVVPVNPNGATLYTYPFATLRSNAMQAYIAEWFSPNFHEAKFVPFLLMLIAILVLMAISPQRVRFPQLTLFFATTWMALHAARHIPIFVLVAVPILSTLVEPLFAFRELRKPSGSSSAQVLNYIVLCAFLIFTIVRIRTVTKSLADTERRNFPSAAVRFLQQQRLPGPLLNHYNWGGYMIWKLYPEYRVFIDGRADLYGDEFMDRFADLYYVRKADWYEQIEKYRIQTVMLPPDAPLVGALQLRSDWRQEYADSQAVVLEKSGTRSTDASQPTP